MRTRCLLSLWISLALLLSSCSSPADPPASDLGAALDRGWSPDRARPDVASPDRARDRASRPDVYQQPQPSLGALTLVVNLGDSIAAGYLTPKGQGYRDLLVQNDDQTYPTFKGKDLRTRFPGVQLVDRAVPGATSSDVVGQVAGLPANLTGSTLVLISAGGNDLLDDLGALLDPVKAAALADKTTANLEKVMQYFSDGARYAAPVTIVYLNVFDPTDGMGSIPADAQVSKGCGSLKALGPVVGPAILQAFSAYNASLFGLARGTRLLGDIHAAFLGHGFNSADPSALYYVAADPTLWFQPDCIHPNPRGHHEIRRLIWHILTGE